MEAGNKKGKSVYVASPLGFSEVGRAYYYGTLIPALTNFGLEIVDPWVLTDIQKIHQVIEMPFGQEKKDAWAELNKEIGKNNADGIRKADMLIAVLDGVDVDSGTASEIGHAAALGKDIEGYRGDLRLSADNIGSTVNLQVEYFIRSRGGTISDSLEKLIEQLIKRYPK